MSDIMDRERADAELRHALEAEAKIASDADPGPCPFQLTDSSDCVGDTNRRHDLCLRHYVLARRRERALEAERKLLDG